MNSPNLLFYHCKLLLYENQNTVFDFCEKKNERNENSLCHPGGRAHADRFTLCLFCCVVPSLNLHENPYIKVVPPLLGIQTILRYSDLDLDLQTSEFEYMRARCADQVV